MEVVHPYKHFWEGEDYSFDQFWNIPIFCNGSYAAWVTLKQEEKQSLKADVKFVHICIIACDWKCFEMDLVHKLWFQLGISYTFLLALK